MRIGTRRASDAGAAALAALALLACGDFAPPPPPEEATTVPSEGIVVIYVEAPRRIAGPLLKTFEEQSGIDVQAVYRETPGPEFRRTLEEEARAGRVDLVWADSPLTPLALAAAGLAEPLRPAGARPVPGQYRDAAFRWIGFAVNPRVIIYNHDEVERRNAPASVHDMARPPWGGKGALVAARAGAPAFHAAALAALWGFDRARGFFDTLRGNGTRIVEDDREVRRLVASGEAAWGVLGLDEAICAKREAEPVDILYPDRLGMGALVPPHAVVLVRGAPHPAQAKGLFGYFFATEAAWQLGMHDCALLTLLPNVPKPDWVPALSTFNVTRLDNDEVERAWREHEAYFIEWSTSSPAPAASAR